MMNVRKVIRSAAVALIAAAAFAGTAQTANAAPSKVLTRELAELWTTVLQTPSDEARHPDLRSRLDLRVQHPLGVSTRD
jgi:TRAP-type mannitol/chloroaromatic compound transport system substrate-binding protein